MWEPVSSQCRDCGLEMTVVGTHTTLARLFRCPQCDPLAERPPTLGVIAQNPTGRPKPDGQPTSQPARRRTSRVKKPSGWAVRPGRKATSVYRSAHWRRVREFVLDRDGWRCNWCGCDLRDPCVTAVGDHLISPIDRPDLALMTDNVVAACSRCNTARANASAQARRAAKHRDPETGTGRLPYA
jgi:hypothetical protein